MDSLDELLADLHSAATHIRKEQRNSVQSQNSHRSSSSSGLAPVSPSYHGMNNSKMNRNSSGSQRSMSGEPAAYKIDHTPGSASNQRYSAGSSGSGDYPIAPPLPPPPSRDVIDEVTLGYSGEPIYEPQNIQYSGKAVGNNNVIPRTTIKPTYHNASQSALGANLNELDYLLQDLNSSQFMQAMSRSDSDNSVKSPQSPNTKIGPPTKPKPTRKVTSPKGAVTFNVQVNNGSSMLQDDGRASSATRELDELMQSLSQFKLNANLQQTSPNQDDSSYAQVSKSSSQATTPSPAATQPNELDSMLGSLESDMKGHGVSVSTKGLCGACSKPVLGQVITALGKIWHVEHFCCHNCREELGTRSFFERDEMPYCENCYHQLFAPLCGKCNTAILDKCVTAMDSTWHMECFVCNHCNRSLNDEVFHEKDGQPYCRDDYFKIFAPKCGSCELPIIEDFISTLNRQWHTNCFRCMECGVTLAGGSFYDHDGLPYCETHYYAKRGSLCAGCQQPITGRCITAMFRKFHPEHFVCAFCLKQLNKGTFKEQNDKPYCHPCYIKLFG